MKKAPQQTILKIAQQERAKLNRVCKGKVRGWCGAGAMQLWFSYRQKGYYSCVVHGWYRGQRHNWNEVRTNGKWYLVDITAEQFRGGKPLTVRRRVYHGGPYRPQGRTCWANDA